MGEFITVSTYEYGVITGEIVKIVDNILFIRIADGTIIQILR